MVSPIRLVFVPWGADSFGDDLWLFENGLILVIETMIDALEPRGSNVYADLYDQLSGQTIRTAPVRPLGEPQLEVLGTRAPKGTNAIVDGVFTVERAGDGSLRRIEAALRLVLLPSLRVETPDAFVYDQFSSASGAILPITSSESFHALALAMARVLLGELGAALPSGLTPAGLMLTSHWEAFLHFIKAKRLARTAEEKIGYYRQAVALAPDFFWAQFNLGQMLKQQDDFVSARRAFLAASHGAGDDPAIQSDALFELGLCSIHLGDTKTARAFWDDALSHAPQNPNLLVNIAGTYEQEEDWLHAIDLHEHALAISPGHHKALVSLARLRTMTGQVGAAIPLYHRALAIEPNDPLREAILGGCYLSTGDAENARLHLSRAAQLDPPREAPIAPGEPTSPGDYARTELAKLGEP